MRIKVQFGFIDTKEVDWWKPIDNFPNVIKFLGRNYEWITYDKDLTGNVDMILVFSEIPNYDPNYGVLCPTWAELFPSESGGCECGARHTSFPWAHMLMCRLHKPWSHL